MNDNNDFPPAMALQNVLVMLVAVMVGAFTAAVLLPDWLPGLSESLLGATPKAYWYLSRASAFVAYGLLWLSMAWGIVITNKMARVWPGGPTAFDLHQHASLLGLALALFHALILMGDAYIQASITQVLIPSQYPYRTLWVGLGQVGLLAFAVVALSFYGRRFIGQPVWRKLHYLSFGVFGLALLHGLGSGTDTSASWVQWLYWVSGGSVLFLTVFRVLVMVIKPAPKAKPTA